MDIHIKWKKDISKNTCNSMLVSGFFSADGRKNFLGFFVPEFGPGCAV